MASMLPTMSPLWVDLGRRYPSRELRAHRVQEPAGWPSPFSRGQTLLSLERTGGLQGPGAGSATGTSPRQAVPAGNPRCLQGGARAACLWLRDVFRLSNAFPWEADFLWQLPYGFTFPSLLPEQEESPHVCSSLVIG